MVKVVPVSVTVTTLMAVTLFMDIADVRLAGWVSILSCLGPRSPVELYSMGDDPCLVVSYRPTLPLALPRGLLGIQLQQYLYLQKWWYLCT